MVEVVKMGTGYRVRGSIGGKDYWIDANSVEGTINLPATGEIDFEGLSDLYELIGEAAMIAGID